MSDFTFVSSVCMAHSSTLVYRSTDGQIGLVITSGGRKKDRRRYFVWALPDSAPAWDSEHEARAALVAATPQKEAP
jgi:hypothetical protein